MKNFPGTIKGGLIVLSIFSVQACTQRTTTATTDGKPAEIVLEEAEVTNPGKFCAEIEGNVSPSATYGFVVVEDGNQTGCCGPAPCSTPAAKIKTDQITKASPIKTPPGATPFWGSHVTQRLSALKSADVKLVVDRLTAQP